MTTNNLTEQWKRRELETGWYYYKRENSKIEICYQFKALKYPYNIKGDDIDDVVEVLAPVPSYEEWQQMKAFCEEFNALNVAEENQKLKEEIKMLKEVIYDLGGFECPKCGKYHNRHFICWNCGYDYTAPEV